MRRNERDYIGRNGFFRRLFDRLSWLEEDDAGRSPMLEQLEGRMLLSANPLSELYDNHAPLQAFSEPAIHASLTPGERSTVAVTSAAADVTPPSITVPSIANNALLSSPVAFTATVMDAGSDSLEWSLTFTNTVTGIQNAFYGDPVQTPGSTRVRHTFQTVDPAAIGDGDYVMTFVVTDAAGNSATYSANVRIDVTPPAIDSITINRETLQTFESVQFTVNAQDTFGVTKYTFAINGENVSITTKGVASYTFQEAGTYELVATASDKAGNVSTYRQTITVAECPDVKAPSISITGMGNGYCNEDTAINLSIKDTDSLYVDWTLTLVNNATGAATVLATGDRTTGGSIKAATLMVGEHPDGEYTLVVEAVDKGGNAASKSMQIVIDTVAPTLSLKSTTEHWETGKTEFYIDAYDATRVTSTFFYINGKRVYPDASGRHVYDFTTPGQYTLRATAQDPAGNLAEVTRVVEITGNTDTVAPTVVIHTGGGYHSGSLPVYATVVDDRGGYVEWTVRLIDGNGETIKTSTENKAIQNEKIANYYQFAGAYTIEVEARDPAGNVSIARIGVIWDNTDPKKVSESELGPYNACDSFTKHYTYTDDSPMTWEVIARNRRTGEQFLIASGTGGDISYSFNPIKYSSGLYDFDLYVTDAAGNVSGSHFTRRVDAHPPQFIIESVTVEGSAVKFVLYGYDDWYLSRYQIKNLTTDAAVGLGVSHTEFIGNCTVSRGGVYVPKPGSYTFQITAFDSEGNTSVQTVTVPVYW